MAIFYPHIKGFDGSAYTWIDFQHSSDNDTNKLPLVKYNTNNIKESATSLGRLVATGAPTIFERSVSFNWETQTDRSRLLRFSINSSDNEYKAWICGALDGLKCNINQNSTQYLLIKETEANLKFGTTTIGDIGAWNDKTAGCLYIGHPVDNLPSRRGDVWAEGSISAAGHMFTNSYIQAQNYILAGTYMEAPYFNATSDKRAKTDIQLLSINALDLIKSVQLYSFKYKDSNKPSIGIIAQEVQDIDIQGFNLVDNIEARGENGDYMTVKESKLVYILWKAMQELSAEVEELKQQLKKD